MTARTARRRGPLPFLAAVLAAAAVVAVGAAAQVQERPRRIAIFGSSVAFGTGDESGREGYAGLLRAVLVPRGWEVVNQSRGGDNTATLMSRFAPDGAGEPGTRYLLPVHPGYVVVALSLGNEGIRAADGTTAKDAIFEQYSRGLRALVDRTRAEKMVPVVTLCYARMDFTAVEYEYTRRMNTLINSWDVPSVNLLGAVDDGTGKWARGFWWDSLHPNASGHAELATTFVPSLFDALERGIPRPARPAAAGYARLTGGAALAFAPEAPMHPYALAFTVRTTGDGAIARVSGRTLAAQTGSKTITRPGQEPQTIESMTLNPDAVASAAVTVRRGVWAYESTAGTTVASSVPADGRWHDILVSHYTARGETLFFVDGILAGRAPERLAPESFVIGGPSTERRMDLKDVLIYRSALNAGEAAALHSGKLLQASLEVYAPLADARAVRKQPLENRAQSLAILTLESGQLAHIAR